MKQKLKWLIICFSVISQQLFAGPPFITDDPEVTEYKHWEIFLFSDVDKTHPEITVEGPAVEIDYGLLKRLEFSTTIPLVYNSPDEADEANAYGIGDLELELKYVLVKETKKRPQVVIEPTVFIPTGDADRGLGNGRVWEILPIWMGKKWDKWDVYGGGGYARNPAEGERNFFFGGVVVEHDFTDKLTIGLEFFSSGATSRDQGFFVLMNVGGSYKIVKDAEILFSIGHSVAGAEHVISYLGVSFSI